MEAHQVRVIEEQKELALKIEKLEAFITDDNNPTFAKLDIPERARLRAQLTHMQNYDGILKQRIAAFPKAGHASA